MNLYEILIFLFAIIAILVLIYFACYNKLKNFKDKMDKAESIIDINLNNKMDLIISLNGDVKKVTGKKDYLKDYVSIRDLIITNIEKDLKLEEAEKLINDLARDYDDLSKDADFTKNFKKLREVDEVLISAKNLFNQNAMDSNKLVKNFPYNVVAKIAHFRIRSFYTTKKNEDTF